MPIVELKNVSMSYDGKKVIDNLSLSVDEGDYLCIVGENGSGKTTLLRGLLGLKKTDSGEIVFSNSLKNTQIGYLPQQNDFQKDFPASVKEVVRSGCLGSIGLKPFYSSKEKTRAKIAMQKLGIEDISKKCYHDLSGGQQQRVLLARAICASERLIILDEPVTGLDTVAAEEMYAVIDSLNKDRITVIMISHDVKRAVKCAKHILHLGDRKKEFYGTASEYENSNTFEGLWR